ncbi:hypothetical protein Geob_3887 [Geotalea daltonii FRC-32]|uniref:Lipoprotein n=1 Tax=Geotalea daltonii (strain DSM 22248 / JCM 15807 / FRC-32) TaxID=316067 RepID=A0A068F256_GEODF|nr:hypothetical protein Geob_3887 [Geotalea daltonii FRC-32]
MKKKLSFVLLLAGLWMLQACAVFDGTTGSSDRSYYGNGNYGNGSYGRGGHSGH